jgi:exopolyphosphatase/guanosine-5'-triphosphate,3'-diphosphate pyrophosphatase
VSRIAAVDVGTNSTRLLVAEDQLPLQVVERQMRITRLGQGVDATGHLDDSALERTLMCIADYATIWRELGADRVRLTATSAVRDASDRERFFSGVRERAGIEAEVLSGEDEGRTAFRGATALIDGQAPYLVLDIGGGSTEFILGTDAPEAMTSRQLGCVRVAERELLSDPPSLDQIAEARGFADGELDAVEVVIAPGAARTLVGVAGTITTIAALHLALDTYQPDRIHGSRIPAEQVAEITERLLAMTSAERRALGPMAPGREDVIHAGALILDRVMARYGFADVLVSESDILDGLAMSLLD